MADEPAGISAVVEAPEAAAPEIDDRTFTPEELRSLSPSELRALAPQLDAHIDEEAEARHQKEMERLIPERVAEIREMVARENEEKWLSWVRDNKSRADYLEAKDQIEQARIQRGQKALERDSAEQTYLVALRDKVAQKWADKLYAVAPSEVKALAAQRWAPGEQGILDYIEEVQARLVDHGVKSGISGAEKLIERTAMKDALAGVQAESPDVGGTSAARRGGEMKYETFMALPLAERQRIRREERARYDRITAS